MTEGATRDGGQPAAAGARRPVDGVLFDIDDTLVDTRAAFAAAMAEIARTHLPHLTPDRHPALVDMWRSDAAGRYRAYTEGRVTYLDQRRARADDLHSAFGGPALDDEGFAAWNDVFETAFSAAWAALPGAAALVDGLVDAGLAVGALSNAAMAYQAGKLERAGLLARVPMLVGVDTLGVGKPDPRVFVEACRRLGTDPGRTAYVGDELEVDAVAAVRAGLVGVWVDRPGLRRSTVTDDGVERAREQGVLVVDALAAVPAALGLAR